MASNLQTTKAKIIDMGRPDPNPTDEPDNAPTRAYLNQLLGLPARHFYPAFRVDIAQVREAIQLLEGGDPYLAEKVLYPHQSKEAVTDGLFGVFKAGYQAADAEKEMVAA